MKLTKTILFWAWVVLTLVWIGYTKGLLAVPGFVVFILIPPIGLLLLGCFTFWVIECFYSDDTHWARRRLAFWISWLVIIISMHTATLFYLDYINWWGNDKPGYRTLAFFIFILLSSIPFLIWWGFRRFEYVRSTGPLILFVLTYSVLLASEHLIPCPACQ